MGWNTSALFVKRPVDDVIAELRHMFVPTDREIHFEEASSWLSLDPNYAIAAAGAWSVLWCPSCSPKKWR